MRLWGDPKNSKDEKVKKRKIQEKPELETFENKIKDDGLKYYFKIKQMKM